MTKERNVTRLISYLAWLDIIRKGINGAESFTYLSKLLSFSLAPNSVTLSQKALSIFKLGQFFPVRTNLISQVFINRHPTSLTSVAGQFFHLFIPHSYSLVYIHRFKQNNRIDRSVLHRLSRMIIFFFRLNLIILWLIFIKIQF